MSAAPELPPEVLDRLAACDRVKLQVGPLGASLPVQAVPAPLRGQLYLLFPSTSALDELFDQSCRAAVEAAAPDGSWSVLARGRILWGRTAQSDPRRSELAHWLPEGASAAGLQAARFYPEELDYQTQAADGRRRANGPVPGHHAVPAWRALWDIAGAPFAPWFLATGLLVGFGILALAAPEERNVWVLLPALLAGPLSVVAAGVGLAPYDLARWRSALERDAELGVLSEARFSPAELRGWSGRLAGLAAFVWALLAVVGSGVVVGLVSLLSGAPIIILVMAVRRRARAKGVERG